MARHTKLNSDVIERLAEAVRNGGRWPVPYVRLAEVAGVDRITLYRWLVRGHSESDGLYVQLVSALAEAEADRCERPHEPLPGYGRGAYCRVQPVCPFVQDGLRACRRDKMLCGNMQDGIPKGYVLESSWTTGPGKRLRSVRLTPFMDMPRSERKVWNQLAWREGRRWDSAAGERSCD